MKRISNSILKHTAQAYLRANKETEKPTGACGSACGAGDEKPEPETKPTACGSACGAGEK